MPKNDNEQQEIDMYGADAAEWLRRWDNDEVCWSIEMGGLGPPYEQCIQITAAEVLRHLLEKKYDADAWKEGETWEHDRNAIEAAALTNTRINSLGLSGAQFGAALWLACRLYRDGPRAVLTDERMKDRRIQVMRVFPADTANTEGEA